MKLKIPFYERDYYHWLPNWKERPAEEEKILINELVQNPEWIVDGYQEEADTVIWLDFSFARVMYRVIKRSFLRGISRKRLWHNNIEPFFSKESMIFYVLENYNVKKKLFERFITEGKFQNKKFIRIRNKKEEMQFWDVLNSPYNPR